MYKNNLIKTLNTVQKVIGIKVINDLLIIYHETSKIIVNINNIFNNNTLLKFSYKKLYNTIISELKSSIPIKKILKIITASIKYMYNKYVLNCSFIELCTYYIFILDINGLKNHICNKLDIILYFKITIKFVLRLLKTFIIYLIEKYYYKCGLLYFKLKYFVEIDTYILFTILDKIKKLINIKYIFNNLLQKELKLFYTLYEKEMSYFLVISNMCIRNEIGEIIDTYINKLISKIIYLIKNNIIIDKLIDIICLIKNIFVRKDTDKFRLSKIIAYIDLICLLIVISEINKWDPDDSRFDGWRDSVYRVR